MTVMAFALLVLFVFVYLIICRYFRFRRLKSILLKYDHIQVDYLFDIPYTITTSLSFALFRTYGIPTISRLLVQTNELVRSDVIGCFHFLVEEQIVIISLKDLKLKNLDQEDLLKKDWNLWKQMEKI